MKISDNILYQRNNFNEIYKSYFNEVMMETAVSYENNYEIEENKYLVIITDEYENILRDIFYISFNNSETYLDIENSDEIIIKKGYEDEVTIEDIGGKVSITYMIPYRLRGIDIRIIKKVKYSKIKDAALIIVNKKLSLFDKRTLQEKEHRLVECYELDNIKSNLLKFKAFYNEKNYIKKQLDKVEKKIINTNMIEDSFKINIAISFINYLSSDEAKKKDKFFLMKEITNSVIDIYKQEANKIVKKYLRNDFEKNYYVINKLMNSIDRVNKNLYKNITKSFINELDKILKLDRKKDRYLALMQSKFMDIDELLSKELSYLDKDLNYIILEEKC